MTDKNASKASKELNIKKHTCTHVHMFHETHFNEYNKVDLGYRSNELNVETYVHVH